VENEFFKLLALNAGKVEETFYQLMSRIQKGIIDSGFNDGTTLVSCFIDKDKKIYTATIGDSEARLFRKIAGVWKAIPLSRVVDWSTPMEAERAARALRRPSIAEEWPKSNDPKDLYYTITDSEGDEEGVNVSRSLGDTRFAGRAGEPAVISEPLVSTLPGGRKLKAGDRLIIACDGLWDYSNSEGIIQKIQEHNKMKDLNHALREGAISAMKSSNDNVTIIAVKVLSKLQAEECVTPRKPRPPSLTIKSSNKKKCEDLLSPKKISPSANKIPFGKKKKDTSGEERKGNR
jgi:serine/threonine protein phosphatase PrpC